MFDVRELGSLVSRVSDYGLDDRGSIHSRDKEIFPVASVQTSYGAHPASYPEGTGGPFPRDEARPGRDVDHSPQSSAKVVKE
jgi:hypothetical protein